VHPNIDARAEVFASGFISPEGPVFNKEGELFVCDLGVYPPKNCLEEADARNVYRVGREGEVALFSKTGGMPTGAAFHRDGRLFVCDSGRQAILAISTEGTVSVVVSEYEGTPLLGPNDLVFDSRGNLYFTDPKSSTSDNRIGSIYLLRTTGELEQLDTGYAFPNGIALDPKEGQLYLSETHTKRIHRFNIEPTGSLSKRELFATLPQEQCHPVSGPDGMALDVDGNLYVAHWGSGCVDVFDCHGSLVGQLQCLGKQPTNVAFWKTNIYVTEMERGEVVRLDTGVPGLELFSAV